MTGKRLAAGQAPPAGISRRSLLTAAALPVVHALPLGAAPPKSHVAVIGAGAFGGWTALHLLRQGAKVTILDAWGPGNARASSGGETRIIRATYGPERVYVRMVVRALQLWREAETRWRRKLFQRTGVLWMAGNDDQFEKASLPLLREARIPFEELGPAEAGKRFPQVNFEGVKWSIHEKDAGYLRARQACALVLDGFLQEGGEYRQASVKPGTVRGKEMAGLSLSDGGQFVADRYVFACGPWLGSLFPEVIGDRVSPSRQEVFFFGTPAGDPRFLEERLPAWIDNGPKQFYGIPGNDWRGFKMADDGRGGRFDPTSGDRMPTPAALKAAREYLSFRFPGLKEAPLLEARVCQYENTPDTRYIVDRHPQAENVWLVGGGSGHGFKLGPAVGERVADLVLGGKPVDPFFALSRFRK
jgi:glycine/D-amino acid oxidase-like deaminating enzyme